ncbi:MAG TPA: C40 family peptidase [Pyrinomonadaceae bacterium]|nr:C40 family peptidase [Pyrinomonadaceae bacterium]
MPFSTPVPRALAAFCLVCLFAAQTFAQTEMRPRQVAPADPTGNPRVITRLENEPFVVSEATTPAPLDSLHTLPTPAAATQLERMMLAAIDARLGTPYRLGSTGPYRYDCSGFVWSVYQSIGVDFERSSARSLWQRFAPATGDERFKFGTLVFFNNLNHVGIVAGEHGFYHASTSKGVVYSPFNDYWLARLDGFRRAPSAAPDTPTLASMTTSRK